MLQILLTGATGFLGSVILYFLLLNSNVKIYVLIRSKKGLTMIERLEQLYQKELFSKINRSEFFSRVTGIAGDTTLPLLGISDDDRKFCNATITHLIHSAASVKFDDELTIALDQNVYPATQIKRLINRFQNFKRWIHISTAYVAPPEHENHTFSYFKNPFDIYKGIKKGNLDWEDVQDYHSNTYTYTKRLCESIIQQYKKRTSGYDILVLRPSIIGPSQHVQPAWCDSLAAITGYVASVVMGVVTTCQINTNCGCINVVPVDHVAEDVIKALDYDGDLIHSTGHQFSAEVFNTITIQYSKQYPVSSIKPSMTLVDCQSVDSNQIMEKMRIFWVKLMNKKQGDKMSQFNSMIHSNFDYFTSHTWNFKPTFDRLPLDDYYHIMLDSILNLVHCPKNQFPIAGRNHNSYEMSIFWAMPRHGYSIFMLSAMSLSSYFMNTNTKTLLTYGVPLGLLGTTFYNEQARKGYHWTTRCAAIGLRSGFKSILNKITVDVPSFSKRTVNPCIIMASHRSYLDFLIIPFVLFDRHQLGYRRINIVAAHQFRKIPVIGYLMEKLGARFVNRDEGSNNDDFKQTVIDMMRNSEILLVFPEGTRSRRRRTLPPKHGVLYAAQQSKMNIDIVPITISYQNRVEESRLMKELNGEKVKFFSPGAFLSWMKDMLFGRINLGNVHVNSGSVEQLTPSTDVRQFAKKVMAKLQSNVVVWTNQIQPKRLRPVIKQLLKDKGVTVIESDSKNDTCSDTEIHAWEHYFYPEAHDYFTKRLKKHPSNKKALDAIKLIETHWFDRDIPNLKNHPDMSSILTFLF